MEIARIIRYWRDSLADAELTTIDPRNYNAISVPTKMLARGQPGRADVRRIFAAAGEEEILESAAGEDGEVDHRSYIPVIVAPYVARRLERSRSRVRRWKPVCPLLIPAALDTSGRLYPPIGDKPALPWLPRTLLEPTSSEIVVGDVLDVERFYAEQALELSDEEGPGRWRALWLFAYELLNSVAGEQWKQDLESSGYKVTARGFVAPGEPMSGMARNILDVYDNLLARDALPPLLRTFASSLPSETRAPLPEQEWSESAQRHLGSLQNEYALSPTQREALYNFLALPDETVLAISGPPGTGKTTLLHSVVASLWVEAALEGGRPPTIVVSSTNNQAVINVVNSLQGAGSVERWIDVPSFGLYLVNSRSRQKQAAERNIPWVNRYGDGFPEHIEDGMFISNARVQFLQNCGAYFDREFNSLDEALESLHSGLQRMAKRMQEGVAAAFTLRKKLDRIQALESKAGNLEEIQNRLEELRVAETELSEIEKINTAWQKHISEESLLYTLTSFVPSMDKRRRRRHRRFKNQYTILADVSPTAEAIDSFIRAKLGKGRSRVSKLRDQYGILEELDSEPLRSQQRWQGWKANVNADELDIDFLLTLEDEEGMTEKRSLLNWLDTNLRHDLFVLAVHYWEGRWLQEVQEIGAGTSGFKERQTRDIQEKKWQRYAMLTPCLITTKHTGPGFFDYYDGQSQPLFEFIDLLIVDEAGQVTPEVGGAMFALARQALVVGDVKQIEPIWSLTEAVDRGNLERRGLVRADGDFGRLSDQGITASSGSLMRMAQHASPYQIPPRHGITYERGMFLAEHRRCVPEIISYCNELAYSGRLRMKRERLPDHPWPHMAYVHIKGRATRQGGSRKNEREARAVAAWLAKNQEALQKHYQATLTEIVAVITPFAAQKQAILGAVKQEGLDIEKVGTVHTMQGAERPVILFSTVYDHTSSGPYFFDRGVNMLNVAVSRAKDSFIVFGDMDILDPAAETPSGLLAHHLFASEENELLDAPLPERVAGGTQREMVHPVRTLKRHVATLKRSFERAQERLVIVSPYLRRRAVQADHIARRVAATVKRGVEVCIYVDDGFNENLTLTSAKQAATVLRENGAKVIVCHNIHSKIVCIDEDIFVEGSFNWLSAERKLEKYRRYETSTIYMGPQAPQFIREVISDLRERVIEDA